MLDITSKFRPPSTDVNIRNRFHAALVSLFTNYPYAQFYVTSSRSLIISTKQKGLRENDRPPCYCFILAKRILTLQKNVHCLRNGTTIKRIQNCTSYFGNVAPTSEIRTAANMLSLTAGYQKYEDWVIPGDIIL